MVDTVENTETVTTLYNQDFYAWTQEQAAKLRAGQWAKLDVANLAEELEDLGKSQKKELKNRLIVLLAHLLKWQFQPDRRTTSWEVTITNQRLELADHLSENPSLNGQLNDVLQRSYRLAIGEARKQTHLKPSAFPENCPYTQAQIFNSDFWPGGAPEF